MGKTFDVNSTADDVLEGVDLRGKRVRITGASTVLEVETIAGGNAICYNDCNAMPHT